MAKKKLLIIAGHGEGDPGACSIWGQEADYTRELATMVKKSIGSKMSVTMYDQKKNCYTVSYQTVGSGDATARVPNFGVSYYARGGIMTRPTLFGINGRNGMVGGEAGDEAILPLDTLWGKMKDVVSAVVENKFDKRESRKSLSKEAVSKRSSGTTYNKYEVHMHVDIESIDSLKKLKNLLDELESPDGEPQVA